MGVLLALFSAVFYSISTIISKVSVDKGRSAAAVGVVYQFASGIAVVLLFIFDAPRVLNGTLQTWGLLALSCLGYGAFTYFGFKSNKLLEISVSNIFGQISMVLTFFASAVLFHEDLTWAKLLGIALLVGGNLILIGPAWKQKNVNPKGLLLRALASVAITMSILLDASNSHNFSVSFYAFMAYMGGGVFSWLMSRNTFAEVKDAFVSNWRLQLIMGALSAVGYYFFIKAFALAPKIVVVPLNNLNAILVVLLGIVLLKETKNTKLKIIAGILAFAGAVLLSI